MEGSLHAVRVRLFVTCWLIFVLHFATDFVREHYLVLSMVDDRSFRLDKYVGLHNDIFVTPHHGAHHGANPGASMLAAIPYVVLKPLIDRVARFMTVRESGAEADAIYDDNRPARVRFYKQVRARGLDVKFGLVSFVTMAFCMALFSAASAVFMFSALNHLGLSTLAALGLAFLYAFGTPVFFRTGYLNQNLLVGVLGFIAFTVLWQQRGNPGQKMWPQLVAGVLAGLAVLCDYSGVVVLLLLGGYGLLAGRGPTSFKSLAKNALGYAGGAIGPLALLWFYQWSSFGHAFYPPQHFMPPQIYSDTGHQGIWWPSRELLSMMLFDPGFGLFVAAPILLLAFVAPVLSWWGRNIVPARETLFIVLLFSAFVLFFSTVEYTRLQWVTGIRYMVPVIPFLFVLVAAVLVQLPRTASYAVAVLAIMQTWATSMVRSVGVPGETVLTSLERVLREGIQLPWLTTLEKMGRQHPLLAEHRRLSLLFFFVLWTVVIYGVWQVRLPWKSLRQG
jgi:hypothetical protein